MSNGSPIIYKTSCTVMETAKTERKAAYYFANQLEKLAVFLLAPSSAPAL